MSQSTRTRAYKNGLLLWYLVNLVLYNGEMLNCAKCIDTGILTMRSSEFPPMRSHKTLNSRPSTKLGSAMSSNPQTSSGTVRSRPRSDLGVISPYPTVVMAIAIRDKTVAGYFWSNTY